MLTTKNIAIAVAVGVVGGAVTYGAYKMYKGKSEKAVTTVDIPADQIVPLNISTTEKNELKDHFNAVWNSVMVDEDYNPDWANGTGYFNHAVNEERPKGTLVRSMDEHGRKIILASLNGKSTMVFFERYTDNDQADFVLIYQRYSDEKDTTLRSDSIDLHAFKNLVEIIAKFKD